MKAVPAHKVMIRTGPLWALAVVLVTVTSHAAISDEWPIGLFQYEVRRSAERIGTHTVTATHDGERLVVNVTEWIEVKGWYGRYCHRAKRREVWDEGKLLRYDSATVGSCSGLVWGWDHVRPHKSCVWGDDREPVRVTAHQNEGKLVIATQNLSAGARLMAAPDTTLSTNFLNPLIRQEQQVQLLDPITGELRAMKILDVGEESIALHDQTVATHKYQYSYIDDREDIHYVWYNRDGVMVMMKHIKDDVIFTLIPVVGSPNQSGPPPMNEECAPDFPLFIEMRGAVP
jgi:Domain of unknown function (DUF6134)